MYSACLTQSLPFNRITATSANLFHYFFGAIFEPSVGNWTEITSRFYFAFDTVLIDSSTREVNSSRMLRGLSLEFCKVRNQGQLNSMLALLSQGVVLLVPQLGNGHSLARVFTECFPATALIASTTGWILILI